MGDTIHPPADLEMAKFPCPTEFPNMLGAACPTFGKRFEGVGRGVSHQGLPPSHDGRPSTSTGTPTRETAICTTADSACSVRAMVVFAPSR
jgi:hypothetical protein